MIDAICKCTICGTPKKDGCRCWVACECIGCGAKWSFERERPMSPNIARMVMETCGGKGCKPHEAGPVARLYDYDGKGE